MIQPSEFREWKSHFVTEAFQEAVQDMALHTTELLIGNVSAEVSDDFYRGYIYALREVLKVDLSEE